MTPNPLFSRKSDYLVAAGCGAVAFINYFATLGPTVGPGDAGELTLAAWKLGIAHPPGYPLFTWLGRIACLLHTPEPAFATNGLTALVAAAAVAVLVLAARRLGFSLTGSVTAALVLGFGPAFWSAATSHEVYAFTILLLALLIFAVAAPSREDEQRTARPAVARYLVPAYLFGLALAHQPTALLWLPALAALAWPDLRLLSPRTSGALLLAALLGFSSSLGTLFLAQSHPVFSWGDPSTLGRLWNHITASQYRSLALNLPSAEFAARLKGLPTSWAAGTSVAALIVAALGAVVLGFRQRRLLLGLLLLIVTVLFAIGYNIPDFRVHLLPSFVAVALLVGAAATWFESRVSALGRTHLRLAPVLAALGVLVALAVPGHQLLLHRARNSENRTTLVRDLGENLLLSLPDSAVIFYGGDVSGNALRYVQALMHARPAVRAVARDMLFAPDYYSALARELGLPGQAELLAQARNGGRDAALSALLAAAAEAFARTRPVYVTAEIVTPSFFAGPLVQRWAVVPEGIVYRLVPRAELPDSAAVLARDRELWSSYRLASLTRSYESDDYRTIQYVYAAARNNLGMFCLERGWTGPAVENLRLALTLPASPELAAAIRNNLARAESGNR